MFRTVPLAIIRSFSLYTQQWYKPLLCIQWKNPDDGQRLCGFSLYAQQWYIPLPCVQWKTPTMCVQWKNSWWWTEELSETCRVYSKNKFEKLEYLFGFTIRIYHDARSPEREVCPLHAKQVHDFPDNPCKQNEHFYFHKFVIAILYETRRFYSIFLPNFPQYPGQPYISRDTEFYRNSFGIRVDITKKLPAGRKKNRSSASIL